MPPAKTLPPPRNVSIGVQLIWLTLALNALMMALDYDDAGSDALVFNILMLLFNGYMAIQIAVGKHWARMAYAVMVALDVALVLALGLDAASDLDVLLTYLSVALECWTLLYLFCAEADNWFRPGRSN
jgi:hypothetical protein